MLALRLTKIDQGGARMKYVNAKAVLPEKLVKELQG